jgi:hypothetical protein
MREGPKRGPEGVHRPFDFATRRGPLAAAVAALQHAPRIVVSGRKHGRLGHTRLAPRAFGGGGRAGQPWPGTEPRQVPHRPRVMIRSCCNQVNGRLPSCILPLTLAQVLNPSCSDAAIHQGMQFHTEPISKLPARRCQNNTAGPMV